MAVNIVFLDYSQWIKKTKFPLRWFRSSGLVVHITISLHYSHTLYQLSYQGLRQGWEMGNVTRCEFTGNTTAWDEDEWSIEMVNSTLVSDIYNDGEHHVRTTLGRGLCKPACKVVLHTNCSTLTQLLRCDHCKYFILPDGRLLNQARALLFFETECDHIDYAPQA